jgi:isopenicillin-N N-acyltransferase-like protein
MTYRSARSLVGTSLVLLALAGCNSRQDGAPVVTAAVPKASARPAAPAPVPAVRAVAERPFPVPVIELRGSGAEIGRGHAEALGSGIRELHDKYLGAYFQNQAAKFLALTTASLFEPTLARDHNAEIKALAAGSAIDPKQMLLAQCFLDLSPMVACSTVTLPASASPDGVARFGRNLDFPSFGVADKRSVVLVYHPAGGRHAFAAVAWPGMVGVLTGMNEHGLTLANMEVTRSVRLPSAMPYTLLYRSVLERCRTVDEAVAFLKKTPRQSANNLMLMDAGGDRAVVELTPEDVVVRRAPPDAALVSTNHQRGADDLDTPGECRRYDRLHATAARDFGQIDEPAVEAMLSGVAQGKYTMQSMVFEPAARVMYLSTGQHAADKEFHRLDLGKLFARPGGGGVASAE